MNNMEIECIRIACDMIGEDVLPTKLDNKIREIDKLVRKGRLRSRQVMALIVWQWKNEQHIKQALQDSK